MEEPPSWVERAVKWLAKQIDTLFEAISWGVLLLFVVDVVWFVSPSRGAHTLEYLFYSAASLLIPIVLWAGTVSGPIKAWLDQSEPPSSATDAHRSREKRPEAVTPRVSLTILGVALVSILIGWQSLVARAESRGGATLVGAAANGGSTESTRVVSAPSPDRPASGAATTPTSIGPAATPSASPSPTLTPPPATKTAEEPRRSPVRFETEKPPAPGDANRVNVFLSSPPLAGRTYWLIRDVPGYDSRRFPQGPATRRDANPYLGFSVALPIPGRGYHIALVECDAVGEAKIREIVNQQNSELPLPETPETCIELGTVTLTPS